MGFLDIPIGKNQPIEKKGKSLRERRLLRLGRAREIRRLMEKKDMSYREAGERFGISGVMAFKLVKELKGVTNI